MALNMMNGFMKRSLLMELKRCSSNIKTTMGYINIIVRVSMDVLGPMYVVSGPIVM